MPSLKASRKSRHNFQPHLVILDGVRKILLAKSIVQPIEVYLAHVEEEEYTGEEFSVIFSIPEDGKNILVASIPVSRETAKSLYGKFKKNVEERKVPKRIMKKLN